MKARIKITLKHGVLDPQGKAIQNALGSLGFTGIEGVRQGKYIEVDLAESDETTARGTASRSWLHPIVRPLWAVTDCTASTMAVSLASRTRPSSALTRGPMVGAMRTDPSSDSTTRTS